MVWLVGSCGSLPLPSISREHRGTSLAVPWLRLCTSTAGGVCSIPGWGTKILHAARCGQKKKKKKKKKKKSQESIVPHITSLGKGQNSKLDIQFLLNAYCFCTIVKLKNCNSGAISIQTVPV